MPLVVLVRSLALLLIFISTGLFAQVLDDSTKEQYGPHTTGIITERDVFLNYRIFYKRDTFFCYLPENKIKLNYKPLLYLRYVGENDSLNTELEESFRPVSNPELNIKQKAKADSAVSAQARALKFRGFKNHFFEKHPDTAITYLHRYNLAYQNGIFYQNLGVRGTAQKPIFYDMPSEIGYQPGFSVYNTYATDPSKVQYFDAKSTYSRLYYLQGSTGENALDVQISKNINPHWNIGFQYKRYSAQKQLNVAHTRDFLLLGQDLLFHVSHTSKNNRYRFMGNFTYFSHKVQEQGGIKLSPQGYKNNDSLFQYGLSSTWLPSSSASTASTGTSTGINFLLPYNNSNLIYSMERRIGYHFYHQYDLYAKGRLTIFHIYDRSNRKYRYEDPFLYNNGILNVGTDPTQYFYRNALDTSGTHYNVGYITQDNKMGIKGRALQGEWSAHIRQHSLWSAPVLSTVSLAGMLNTTGLGLFFLNDTSAKIRLNQWYAGGQYEYRMGDSLKIGVTGEGQFLFNNSSAKSSGFDVLFKNNHDYNLEVYLQSRRFKLGIRRMRSSPTIQQMYINHNDFQWQQALSAVTYNKLYAVYNVELGRQSIGIGPTITAINHFIYNGTDAQPHQLSSDSALLLSSLDLNLHLRFGNFNVANYTRYTKLVGADVIRFPTLFASTMIYYDLRFRNLPNMQFLFGTDLTYRTGYLADAYMPATMQFYIQNNFPVNTYTTIDLFLNARLKNARLFFKLTQLNMPLGLSQGYFNTPYYPGMKFSFQFGVNWFLFE